MAWVHCEVAPGMEVQRDILSPMDFTPVMDPYLEMDTAPFS
jgi:acyl CoA:acetate/3-ketoacid CoA transferase